MEGVSLAGAVIKTHETTQEQSFFRFTPTTYFWRHIAKQAAFVLPPEPPTEGSLFLPNKVMHFGYAVAERSTWKWDSGGREKRSHGHYRRVQFGRLAINEHANAPALILLLRPT